MEKRRDGKYVLSHIELGSLINASIEHATKVLHDPQFDPAEDALPYIVNAGYKFLYGCELYSKDDFPKK